MICTCKSFILFGDVGYLRFMFGVAVTESNHTDTRRHNREIERLSYIHIIQRVEVKEIK